VRDQARAYESAGTAAGRHGNRSARPPRATRQEVSSSELPGVRQIVFGSDAADHAVSEQVSFRLVQRGGPQYADPQRVQLGKPDRPDARRDVGFDDAERICRLLQRANVHRDMRPYGSGHVPHQRRAAGIGVGEKHISPIQHRGEGSPFCRRDAVVPSERLGKITSEGRLETQHRCATRMTSLPNLLPSRRPTNARGAFSSDMVLWNTVQPPFASAQWLSVRLLSDRPSSVRTTAPSVSSQSSSSGPSIRNAVTLRLPSVVSSPVLKP
jgi:hypothetical protein